MSFCNQAIQYVSQFRYLGRIIDNQLRDIEDIKREIRNLFMRTYLLHRRFNKCSIPVKLMLFRSSCMSMPVWYCIWRYFSMGKLDRLKSCFHKCIKIFLVMHVIIVLLRCYKNCACLLLMISCLAPENLFIVLYQTMIISL